MVGAFSLVHKYNLISKKKKKKLYASLVTNTGNCTFFVVAFDIRLNEQLIFFKKILNSLYVHSVYYIHKVYTMLIRTESVLQTVY